MATQATQSQFSHHQVNLVMKSRVKQNYNLNMIVLAHRNFCYCLKQISDTKPKIQNKLHCYVIQNVVNVFVITFLSHRIG